MLLRIVETFMRYEPSWLGDWERSEYETPSRFRSSLGRAASELRSGSSTRGRVRPCAPRETTTDGIASGPTAHPQIQNERCDPASASPPLLVRIFGSTRETWLFRLDARP